ncbi:CDP-diacylglycerol--inositol 3-phosphatidyltransferase [Chroicocephalus ridibundus]|uniref:CDP-diacylglycerol--inositol 3-phosphatidyltransferase n=1 Tax=Chroicocephalus ridibundus TaxID=1192867 RepID=UPI002FDEC157
MRREAPLPVSRGAGLKGAAAGPGVGGAMAGGESVNVFLFVPNLIGYARLALAAASFYLMPQRPGPAAACYALAGAPGRRGRARGPAAGPGWAGPRGGGGVA